MHIAQDCMRGRTGRMEVIEKYVCGKISEELCEDICFVSDHFVAVIDGVTAKSDFLHNGKKTGKLAAEIVEATLRTLPHQACVIDFIRSVNDKMRSFYKQIDFSGSEKMQGLQAVCAVYSEQRREIWMIGDCQVCVDGKNYLNPKRSDEILSEVRSLVLETLKAEKCGKWSSGEVQREARKIIEPWIVRASVFANCEESEFGYAVLNGEEIPPALIRVIRLDGGTHEIIFTSDGYPMIAPSLKESEDYLQVILHSDRECSRLYRTTKGVGEDACSFDDRAYIRFSV